MPDNPLDSDPQAGTVVPPSTPPSSQTGAQPPSGSVTISKEEFDGLKQTLSQLESLVRSDKDKGINKVNQRLDKVEGELKPILERASAMFSKGASVEEVLTEVQSVQDETEFRKNVSELAKFFREGKLPAVASNGNASTPGEEVAKVMKEYELLSNDPAVAALYELKGDALRAAAADMAYRRKIKPPPDPSAAPPAGGQPQGVQNADADIKKMDELLKEPTKNAIEIEKLKKSLDERGWK